MKKYIVTLTENEREALGALTSKGKQKSQKIINALILLGCDEGEFQKKRSMNKEIARVLNISMKKIDRVKKRFVEEGLDIVLKGEFFHMDALSSAVAMKVNCDLQLTLMASSLYRLLAARIGRGYLTAKSQHIFRDFIDATASVCITEDEIQVRFQKRAHNPLLIAAGFHETDIRVPWLGGKRLQLIFG